MIDILNVEFYDNFNSEPSYTLKGCVSSFIRAKVKFYVHWESLDVGLTFDSAANTITSSANWFDDGFLRDDFITVVGTNSNNGTYRIKDVSDSVVTLYDDNEIVDEQAFSCEVHGVTKQRNANYYFGLIENGVENNYLSILDGVSEMKFKAENIDAEDESQTPLLPFTGNKHWITGEEIDSIKTNIKGVGIGTTGLSTGYEQVFEVEHYFHINTYIESQFTDGKLNKELVEYLLDTNSLKYAFRVETSGEQNVFIQNTDEGNVDEFIKDGQVGWYNEVANGGEQRFFIDKVEFRDKETGVLIDGLGGEDVTSVKVTISASNGGFFDAASPQTNNCTVNFQRVVPEEAYLNLEQTYAENTFFNSYKIKQVGANFGGGFFENGVFTIIDSNEATVEFDFEGQTNFEVGDAYLLELEVQSSGIDSLRDSDKQALIIQEGEFVEFLDVDGHVEETVRINEHPFNTSVNGFTQYQGWVNDDIVVHDQYLISDVNSKGKQITLESVQLTVEVENTSQTQSFALEEYEVLSVGDEITTGHNLAVGDEKNVGKLVRNAGIDTATKKGYDFQYGIKARFEEWLFQANAIVGNGNEKKWSNFTGIDGWQSYIIINTNLTIGGVPYSIRRRQKLNMYFYQEFTDCDVQGVINTIGETSGINLGGGLAKNEDTIVEAVFTGDGLDCYDFATTEYWGVLHYYLRNEDTIYSQSEISSEHTPKPSNGWRSLIGGLTEVTKSVGPNTVTLRAVLETTTLDQSKTNYTLEARLGKKTFQIPETYETETCAYAMPDPDGYYEQNGGSPSYQVIKLDYYDTSGGTVTKTDVLPLLTTDIISVDLSTLVYNNAGFNMNFIEALTDFFNQNATVQGLFRPLVFSRTESDKFNIQAGTNFGFDMVLDSQHVTRETTFKSSHYNQQSLIDGQTLGDYTPECGDPLCIQFPMPETNQYIIDNDLLPITFEVTELELDGVDYFPSVVTNDFSIAAGSREIDNDGCEQEFVQAFQSWLTNESGAIGINEFFYFEVLKDQSLPNGSCDNFTIKVDRSHSYKITVARQGQDAFTYEFDADATQPTFTHETDPDYCGCPEGFNENLGVCERQDTEDATFNNAEYTASAGDVVDAYGDFGANFYENVTGRHFPMIVKLNPDRLVYSDNDVVDIVENVRNSLWGTTAGTDGRLNNVGIFTSDTDANSNRLPLNEWIGFSQCFQLTEDKVYSIGFGGDNAVRIKIDGVKIAELGSYAGQFNFKFWHVVEINLSQGTHIIEVEGLNTGSEGSFGYEIYDATVNQLRVMTTQLELDAVILASSVDQIGNTYHSGENSGYSCPDGYALDYCSGSPTCSIYTQAPYTPCFGIGCDPECTIILNTLFNSGQANARYGGNIVDLLSVTGLYSDTGLPAQNQSTTIYLELRSSVDNNIVIFSGRLPIGEDWGQTTPFNFQSTEGFNYSDIQPYIQGKPYGGTFVFQREDFAKDNGYIDDGVTDNSFPYQLFFTVDDGNCRPTSNQVTFNKVGIIGTNGILDSVRLQANDDVSQDFVNGVIDATPSEAITLTTEFEHYGLSYGTINNLLASWQTGDTQSANSNTSQNLEIAQLTGLSEIQPIRYSGDGVLNCGGVNIVEVDPGILSADIYGNQDTTLELSLSGEDLTVDLSCVRSGFVDINNDISDISIVVARGASIVDGGTLLPPYYNVTYPNGTVATDSQTGLSGNLSYSNTFNNLNFVVNGAGLYTVFCELEANGAGTDVEGVIYSQFEIHLI